MKGGKEYMGQSKNTLETAVDLLVQNSFSGYFCAYGRSEISFIHNLIAILCVRIPGVYLTSKIFPDTLFPMGLATATGSLLSVIICMIAFDWLKKQKRKSDDVV